MDGGNKSSGRCAAESCEEPGPCLTDRCPVRSGAWTRGDVLAGEEQGHVLTLEQREEESGGVAILGNVDPAWGKWPSDRKRAILLLCEVGRDVANL